MWCSRCGQDVPGVASTDEVALCCARCGGKLDCHCSSPMAARQPDAAHSPAGVEDSPGDPDAGLALGGPGSWDDWETDELLRHLRRKLQPPGADAEAARDAEHSEVDLAHAGPPGWHCTPARKQAANAKAKAAESSPSMSGLVWLMLSVGLMAFVCGGVLLGWSVLTGRQELWSRGMPFAVVGQIALLVGLILQLERLWRDSRRAVSKLDRVDEELRGLKSTTAMLGTTHSSAASAFYSHMAGGANPQLLLADLKGQLDMLTVKIGREEQRRYGEA